MLPSNRIKSNKLRGLPDLKNKKAFSLAIGLIEGDDSAGLFLVVLLPVAHILLNECLVEADDPLEQIDGLLTVVDLSCRELIHALVVSLELAGLEERNRVLDEGHRGQLRQVFVVVELRLASFDRALEFDDASLDLVFAHEDGAYHKLVVLKIVQLLQVINSLQMAGAPTFFKFMSFLDGLKDSLDFKNLVFEPHFDVNEWVRQSIGQIVKVLFQARILGALEQELFLWELTLLWHVLLTTQICVDLGTVGEHRVQLILVEELVKRVGARIVFLILFVHNRDVVNEFDQERLHTLGKCREFHDIVQSPRALRLSYLPMDLVVLLESLQCRRRVEILVHQPVELLVNVLLREDEDLKLFGLDEVGALGHLLDEHAQ